jgi:hypothetical protein
MPTEIILTIAAVIAAVGVIVGGLVSIYRFVKKISDSIGVDRNGRTIAERLDRVEHQLWENGGSSLADRVNIIEAHSIKTSAEVGLIKDLIVGGQPASTPTLTPIRKPRAKKAS